MRRWRLKEFNLSQDLNLKFVDNDNENDREFVDNDNNREVFDDLGNNNEEGFAEKWWGSSDSEDEDYVVGEETDRSFHLDSSNMDNNDEDATEHK